MINVKNIVLFTSFLVKILVIESAYAGKEDAFVDVNIEKDKSYCRKEGSAYVTCYDARSSNQHRVALRSFEIKIKEGAFKDKVVGKIGTKYEIDTDNILISNVDIDEKYRRRGFAEAALRTVLGIYRSEKNQYLCFNHFYLTVSKNNDHLPARNLYEKIGFEYDQEQSNPYFAHMVLDR